MIEPNLGALEDMVAGVDTEFIYEKIEDITWFTRGRRGDELREWIEDDDFVSHLLNNTHPLRLIFGLHSFWSDERGGSAIGIDDDEDCLSNEQRAALDRLALHVPITSHQQGEEEEEYDDEW